ncbi:hypothetical protein WN48_00602 [Eufriesea mexicana]|uniref:Uncharacterized protein n=1 Tax=Eufriesea mexicana TaxID=516756 RepID=A0A310SGF3_9HYME|nr:hypothetical protein WN48_00602 [Eufriesea mexicana]
MVHNDTACPRFLGHLTHYKLMYVRNIVVTKLPPLEITVAPGEKITGHFTHLNISYN